MEAPSDGTFTIKNEAPDATMADQTPQLPSPKRRRSSSVDSLDETEKDAARRYAAKRIKPETSSEADSTTNNGANSEAHSGGNGEVDSPATVKQTTTAPIERNGERAADGRVDFDMAAIIAATTQQIAASAAQTSPAPTQSGFGQLPQAKSYSGTHAYDPYHVMRIESLPVLGNLSTLLLSKLAQGPYDETIRMVTKPESDVGQAYVALKGLFDQTKKMYTQAELPFISADKLGIQESNHRATIRTTNIATFVSSIFGGGEIGFYDLNDHFIETFTPDGEELQKEVTHLYLNFKTQMYLTAMSSGDSSEKEETLASLFPDDLGKSLALRHPGKPLSQSENEFINFIGGRRQFLLNEPSDNDSIAALTRKFEWEDFLQSLSRYLSKHYAPLLDEYRKRHALTVPTAPAKIYEKNGSASVYGQSQQGSVQPYGCPGDTYWAPQPQNNGVSLYAQQTQQANGQSPVDVAKEAKRAADEVLRSLGFGGAPSSPPQHNGVLQYPVFPQNITNGPGPNANGPAQYDKQPASTVALYRRARQSVHAKTSPTKGRPGVSNQARRPWTDEELIALLAGLDAVQGPHWSQIIALHGPGGSLSSALKDRNQVQLKDKARNLKLFFLKENIEVPYYLTFVTGDLKSRAPSLAAKKESEERARLASDEERAKFNGVMSLAGQPGYRQSSQGGNSGEGEMGTNGGGRSNIVEPQTNIRRDSNSQVQFQPLAQQQQSYFQSPYATQLPPQQKQSNSSQPLDTNEQLLMQHLMPFNADTQAADENKPNAQSKAG